MAKSRTVSIGWELGLSLRRRCHLRGRTPTRPPILALLLCALSGVRSTMASA